MMRTTVSGLAIAVLTSLPAYAQMEAQQLIWRCQAAAQDRGLSGSASDAFVQRCVDGGDPGRAAPNRPPPRQARVVSGWRLQTPSSYQVTLSLVSDDRAFSWSFDCVSGGGRPRGSFIFTTFFVSPPNVSLAQTNTIVIDNVRVPVSIDGSEGGVVISDAVAFNTATLSPPTRRLLAEGFVLRVPVVARGGSRVATFTLADGQRAFGDFERRCRALP